MVQPHIRQLLLRVGTYMPLQVCADASVCALLVSVLASGSVWVSNAGSQSQAG